MIELNERLRSAHIVRIRILSSCPTLGLKNGQIVEINTIKSETSPGTSIYAPDGTYLGKLIDHGGTTT